MGSSGVKGGPSYSDGSVQYPGWYLAYVKVGTTAEPIPTEDKTWSGVKSLYR